VELRANNCRVYAYAGGRGFVADQPTVLFVHGSGLDHTVWILQSRYFAHHGYNVLALDLPGHGRSEGPFLPSVEDMADWVIQVMDAATVAQAAMVGHSMGALVTLEAAARYPARISSLSLLGISVPMPVTETLLSAAAAGEHTAIDMVNIWAHSAGAQIGGNPVPGMWMTGGGVRLLERSSPGALHNDLKACNDYQAGLESAARISCPVTLLLGEQDVMASPRSAAELLGAIDGARSVVLPSCGHMMMAEQPDGVLDALKGALC